MKQIFPYWLHIYLSKTVSAALALAFTKKSSDEIVHSHAGGLLKDGSCELLYLEQPRGPTRGAGG